MREPSFGDRTLLVGVRFPGYSCRDVACRDIAFSFRKSVSSSAFLLSRSIDSRVVDATSLTAPTRQAEPPRLRKTPPPRRPRHREDPPPRSCAPNRRLQRLRPAPPPRLVAAGGTTLQMPWPVSPSLAKIAFPGIVPEVFLCLYHCPLPLSFTTSRQFRRIRSSPFPRSHGASGR